MRLVEGDVRERVEYSATSKNRGYPLFRDYFGSLEAIYHSGTFNKTHREGSTSGSGS